MNVSSPRPAPEPVAQLANAAAALSVNLSPGQVAQLLDYLALLQKWNKVYNLTAVRDPADMLTHHLLDSLAIIAPLLRQRPGAKTLLDVGAGAGLPGVVIAICCPQIQVACVDTVAKKAAFINQAAVTLRLPHLRGVHARVENLTQTHEVVCSRAFASLPDFTTWSAQALADGGIWMAMKGKHPQDELAALAQQADPAVEVFHVEQLKVPLLDADRCIVWMKKRDRWASTIDAGTSCRLS